MRNRLSCAKNLGKRSTLPTTTHPKTTDPREFVQEIDEVKVMIGDELLKKVGDLGDAEINLLLMHVEGLLETDEEKNRAQELLERIQHSVQG